MNTNNSNKISENTYSVEMAAMDDINKKCKNGNSDTGTRVVLLLVRSYPEQTTPFSLSSTRLSHLGCFYLRVIFRVRKVFPLRAAMYEVLLLPVLLLLI